MTQYKTKAPVLELQSIRGILMGQLHHTRRMESAGYDCEYERGYIEAKIAALDEAIGKAMPELMDELFVIPAFLKTNGLGETRHD